MEAGSLTLNAKVVGEVAEVGQNCWVNPCRSRMISIVASVASALVNSLLANHVLPSGFSNFMVTVGVNFVGQFCEQLIAILKLVAFTRLPFARGERQASGLALPKLTLEGTTNPQVGILETPVAQAGVMVVSLLGFEGVPRVAVLNEGQNFHAPKALPENS